MKKINIKNNYTKEDIEKIKAKGYNNEDIKKIRAIKIYISKKLKRIDTLEMNQYVFLDRIITGKSKSKSVTFECEVELIKEFFEISKKAIIRKLKENDGFIGISKLPLVVYFFLNQSDFSDKYDLNNCERISKMIRLRGQKKQFIINRYYQKNEKIFNFFEKNLTFKRVVFLSLPRFERKVLIEKEIPVKRKTF